MMVDECGAEVRFFAFCAYVRSYCEPSARAERFAFLMTLLATRQEVSKKRAQAFPLGTPLVRAQTTRRGTAALLMFARKPSGHLLFLLWSVRFARSREFCKAKFSP